MWPESSKVNLPPAVFRILRDLIHDRVGIYFDDSKNELLADKLTLRVSERGFATFLDYYYLLKYGPNAEEEWLAVRDALSVQETYFWREADQIRALVDPLIPSFVKEFPRRPIRIWCGACCTGEEPLTIAMALSEAGWFERQPVEIFASDASPAAIAKARQGIYRDRSFRAISTELKEKYFAQTATGWAVAPALQARVQWSVANLMNPADLPQLVSSPFVFCRNVFIYFSPDSIARTVAYFADKMERPGYLFVGASESLLKVTDEFELHEVAGAFVYKLI